LVGGCVSATATQSGFLQGYDRLVAAQNAGAAEALTFRDAAALAGVQRISLAPAIAHPSLSGAWRVEDLSPLLWEVDAQLCRELAEQFEITTDPSALQVRVAVTAVQRTGQPSSLPAAAANQALPGPGSFRLPVGLGGLAAEAEVIDPLKGTTAAQIVWARRAQVAFSTASLSPVGDAHQLAEPFADAVAGVLRTEGTAPSPTRTPEVCPGFQDGATGRFLASRLTGLHLVPTPEGPSGSNDAAAE
jgi:hypothetical protein